MKITWQEIRVVDEDPLTSQTPPSGCSTLQGDRYRSGSRKLSQGLQQSLKLRPVLLKLYGTYFSMRSNQRTNAFSAECFKQGSYTGSSHALTGSTAMHLCNCVHRHFLGLSVTVRGLASL